MNHKTLTEMYEKEGGPDLHPNRSDDRGLETWDIIAIVFVLMALAFVCSAAMFVVERMPL